MSMPVELLIDTPQIPEPEPIGSYSRDDVIFLLKDIGNCIQEQSNEERERAMQNGKHYSEMLPIEYKPSSEYVNLFYKSLEDSASRIAEAVGVVSQQILNLRGTNVVLVSLARAGTPVGILIKRYFNFCSIDAPHYSISIIRDRGIDENAILYITQRHPDRVIQFIDGWTGKGAITKELGSSIKRIKERYGINISDSLAVLADPGCCANIFGTRDDFLIPSACLNSTVCGLVSRTVLRKDLIEKYDFHGAKYYRELAGDDLSYKFIDSITCHYEKVFTQIQKVFKLNPDFGTDKKLSWAGLKEVTKIKELFGIDNVNLVKPGVGETTRVLLRRVPWKILVKDKNNPDLKHVLLLAKERGVPVEEYHNMTYSCCGLIKSMRKNA